MELLLINRRLIEAQINYLQLQHKQISEEIKKLSMTREEKIEQIKNLLLEIDIDPKIIEEV